MSLAGPAIAGEPTKPTAAPSGTTSPTGTPSPDAPNPPKDAATAIADARRAVEDQRYDEALALLSPLLASSSRATRASALEITAVVRLLVGKAAEGREAVAALYEMAPAFQLDDPSLPPRVTRVFDAEAAIPHTRAVTLAIRASEGERGAFEISTSQPASAIDLACSSAKQASFAPIAVARGAAGLRFRLPTLAAHRCHAVARDADGLPLGRLGSAAHTVDVIVPPVAPPPPLYSRWWLWTSAGVVAAAAVVAGVAVASQAPAAPPAADLTVRPQNVVFAW